MDMNITNDRSALGTVHTPLARTALCLDCEACFEIGSETCPACGSRTWASVGRFLRAVVAR
jgi:hypothetical protein